MTAAAKPHTYHKDVREYFKQQELDCRQLAARVQRDGNAAVTGAANVAKGCIEPFYATEKFALDTFYDQQAAIKTGSDFGNALGGAVVAGHKLSELAKDYVDDIVKTHDCGRLGRDSSEVWHVACDRWNALPEEQKAEKISEFCTSLGVGWGLSKIHALAKSGELLDTLTEMGDALGSAAASHKIKTQQAITRLVDGLLQPEGHTGIFDMPIPKQQEAEQVEVPLQMGKYRPEEGFRGDKNIYSQLDKFNRRKAHVNADGDLVPADPSGMYRDKQVSIVHHIYAKNFPGYKAHSPFISVSGEDGAVDFYGDGKGLKVNLRELRKAIASGEVTGVKIREHEELIKAISMSKLAPAEKNEALAFAIGDKELLLEGIVPKKFLTIL